MNLMIGTIITLFEIIIILFQIHLLVSQTRKYSQMKKDNDEWKNKIESVYEKDIKELINHSKEVLKSFESIIK